MLYPEPRDVFPCDLIHSGEQLWWVPPFAVCPPCATHWSELACLRSVARQLRSAFPCDLIHSDGSSVCALPLCACGFHCFAAVLSLLCNLQEHSCAPAALQLQVMWGQCLLHLRPSCRSLCPPDLPSQPRHPPFFLSLPQRSARPSGEAQLAQAEPKPPSWPSSGRAAPVFLSPQQCAPASVPVCFLLPSLPPPILCCSLS